MVPPKRTQINMVTLCAAEFVDWQHQPAQMRAV